jgi:hypothetical protein
MGWIAKIHIIDWFESPRDKYKDSPESRENIVKEFGG